MTDTQAILDASSRADALILQGGPVVAVTSCADSGAATAATGIGGLAISNPSTLQSTLIASKLSAGAESDISSRCGITTARSPSAARTISSCRP
ncbi:MAG: hypothetical protein ABIO49_10110 [Dokdonella sp.]